MEFLNPLLLYVLATITCFSAVAMVVTQNIVRAATWLLFTLSGTAGLFFLLGADFVGATQLLVYVGGTLVLVVFGVMLTAQGPFINLKIAAGEWAIAACVGVGFFSVLALVLWQVQPPETVEPSDAEAKSHPTSLAASNVLGEAFLGFEKTAPEYALTGVRDVYEIPPTAHEPRPELKKRTRMAYLLPFEIVSVHLLVVLIGAAYLARSKRRRGVVAP